MEALVSFLHDTLQSNFMFTLWLIPFSANVFLLIKRKNILFLLLAAICLLRLIYYGWAMTGLWSTHIYALAFNRSADAGIVLIVALILYVANYGRAE